MHVLTSEHISQSDLYWNEYSSLTYIGLIGDLTGLSTHPRPYSTGWPILDWVLSDLILQGDPYWIDYSSLTLFYRVTHTGLNTHLGPYLTSWPILFWLNNLQCGEHSFIRQLALYSTDDEPSYVLELCPTRKKVAISASYFFSSDMQDSL